MNQYIIFTTEGETLPPNPNITIENCQLLGSTNDINSQDAIEKLFNENQWIEEAGFKKSECICVQILSDSLKSEIRNLINSLSKYTVPCIGDSNSHNPKLSDLLDTLKELMS